MTSDPLNPRPLRILLVDDDAQTRALCQHLLEGLGHHVTVAEDGVAALGLLRDERWDIVLTDHHMPGASGIDVLERAFRLQPNTFRLLMSTSGDAGSKREARTRGHADGFIEKPIDLPLGEFEVRLVRG